MRAIVELLRDGKLGIGSLTHGGSNMKRIAYVPIATLSFLIACGSLEDPSGGVPGEGADSGPSEAGDGDAAGISPQDSGGVPPRTIDASPGGRADGAIDGGTRDASTEGGTGDATVDGGPVRCGAVTCRSDQVCSAGTCKFSCTGFHVPGDFSTVDAAARALAGTGGTICVGAGNFNEEVHADASNAAIPIEIVGESSATTRIRVIDVSGDVRVVGVASDAIDQLRCGRATVEASSVKTARPPLIISQPFSPLCLSQPSMYIDASVIERIAFPYHSDQASSLFLTNSFVGVLDANGSMGELGYPLHAVDVRNSTFRCAVGCQNASQWTAISASGSSLTYYNNIFVGYGTAVNSRGRVVGGNNVFFGNANAFLSGAGPNPGDLFVDPQLDSPGVPTGLLPGSPARGSALASKAPTTDYYRQPRGLAPDRGAVQSY